MLGKDDFPTLCQDTLSTLSCLVTSTECDRVFRSIKKLITPERNQLEDIIGACECLKTWRRNSLIEQQFGHFKKQKQWAAARLIASTAGLTVRSTHFNSRAEIGILASVTEGTAPTTKVGQ